MWLNIFLIINQQDSEKKKIAAIISSTIVELDDEYEFMNLFSFKGVSQQAILRGLQDIARIFIYSPLNNGMCFIKP